MAFIDTNITSSWIYDTTLGGVKRIVLSSTTDIKYIKKTNNSVNNSPYIFTQLKNYQFITGIIGTGRLGTFSIKFDAPFTNSVFSLRDNVLTDGGVNFYTYNSPANTLQTNTLIRYGSDNSFIQSVIRDSSVNELSFFINGFREFTYLDRDIATSSQPSGWFYDIRNDLGDSTPSYNIFLSASSTSVSPSYSIIGSGLNKLSTQNFIAKYIEYDTFNLDFKFYTSTPIRINTYLLTLDLLNGPVNNWSSYLSESFSTTGTYSYTGLVGTNYDGSKNYLVFTCETTFKPAVNYVNGVLSDISCRFMDINIYGTYHPDSNNRLSLTDTTASPIGLSISNAAYSYTLLNNGGTFSIPSRIGNGVFRSGIWENGVWNNGWRDDTVAKEFDDVYLSILNTSDVSWKIEIRGAISAIAGFATGSNVSIGNIVAIDINDNRKLLKGYYQIESLGVDVGNPQNGVPPYGYIRVNLDTSFPYRRIEKDSPNHKIKVTKNIWLSGGFFNGYFSGVWNNGLFKGYPLLTEMFNSHWIDGLFDGGRFNSSYSKNYNFIGIGPKEACSNNFMDLTFDSSSTTPFLVGDYIFITLESLVAGRIGDRSDLYSGVCQIVDVKIDLEPLISDNGVLIPNPNFMYQTITINKRSIGLPKYFDINVPAGTAYRYTASSVIQNFKFYDNNRSRIKSSESRLSSAVFSFNSWIDVNYDDTRAVTLGRDFRAYEPLTGKSVNRNNLYGYPTYDILSSASRFRDSNSLDFKLYKLGTKYKVFTDFIGESSQFNEPFNDIDFTNFTDAGWTYSSVKSGDYNIKRTETLITLNDSQSNALLNSGVTGDELYITASNTGLILNNNNINVKKSRYSVVEFDVITYSVANVNYSYDNSDIYQVRNITSTGLSFSESIDVPGAYLTSSYSINGNVAVEVSDIVVMVDIYGDLVSTIINLVAPNGNIINLKKSGSGVGSRMAQTKFSLREVFTNFSSATSPFSLNNNTLSYSDTYQMDKEIGQGANGYVSDVKLLSDLVSGLGNIYGKWTLYVKYNPTAIPTVCDLVNWSIDIQYQNKVSTNTEPTSSFPLLNFNNLNYDITTQLSGYDNVQVYKKMNYLPITDNVNHFLTKNTFRLDSIELATPARSDGFGKNQKTKKYEYFYNKTDMMMSISGNGATGASTSMVVLDNINMYEVDMIPFFKYFNNTNIYKGIQFPYIGTSPEIDYEISDFVFIDNISIGFDSINPIAVDTTFIGCGTVSFADLSLSAKINSTDTLDYRTSTYQFVNMVNSTTPGSVTSSTTFDSIQWRIDADPGFAIPSIQQQNTLYPLILGLTAGGRYTISIEIMTKNSTPFQSIGLLAGKAPITANIIVGAKPIPTTGVTPLALSFNFVPADGLSRVINQINLLNNYFNSSNRTPNTFKIESLPSKGRLYYNNAEITTTPFTISIVGNVITGLVYFPEGNPTTVNPQNNSFSTSFTYQILDDDTPPNPLTSNATLTINATIPVPTITVDSPLSKDIEYILDELPVNAIKYFTQSELVVNYQNSNLVSANRIRIISVPSRGELSYGPNLVEPGYDILVSDLINGNSFGYWPQGINQNDDTGGTFSTQFQYRVIDPQDFESNLVTFTLDCVEFLPQPDSIPVIVSQQYIDSQGKVRINDVTYSNIIEIENPAQNGSDKWIWIQLNNYTTGSPGTAITVTFRDFTTNEILLNVFAGDGAEGVFSQATTIGTNNVPAYLVLQAGQSVIGTLEREAGDNTYNASMWWSYPGGNNRTEILPN